MRQKLVQRRVEKANCCRQAFQFFEDSCEVRLLIRQQFGQRLLSFVNRPGENHLAHGINPIALKKHVLGAAQPDPRSAEADGIGGLLRRIGVRAHLEPSGFAAPIH